MASEETAQVYRYGRWTIRFEPPPIPVRCCDWQFSHDDFDGSPDANDRRCGYAGSLAEAKAEIALIEADA